MVVAAFDLIRFNPLIDLLKEFPCAFDFRRLLLFDRASCFSNKMFRIFPELPENSRVNTPDNFGNALAGEIGVAGWFIRSPF